MNTQPPLTTMLPPSSRKPPPLTAAASYFLLIWNYLIEEVDDPTAERKADAVLIAASVIATMNYQAGISPPGGVYQESKFTNGKLKYQAGQSIAAYESTDEYKLFCVANTVSFTFSMTTMFLFLTGLSLKRRIFSFLLTVSMFATITTTTYSYKLALEAMTPSHDEKWKEWIFVNQLVSGAVIMWFVVSGITVVAKGVKHLKSFVSVSRQATTTADN